MRLTAHWLYALLAPQVTWAQVPTSTPWTATQTATKALVSTSTSTSVGRVGTLSKAEIGGPIRKNLPRFKYCYEVALKTNPKLSGKVAVHFTIGPTGEVAKASIRSDTLRELSVAACLVKVMRTLRFPPPKHGGVVVVTYPFLFEPR